MLKLNNVGRKNTGSGINTASIHTKRCIEATLIVLSVFFSTQCMQFVLTLIFNLHLYTVCLVQFSFCYYQVFSLLNKHIETLTVDSVTCDPLDHDLH
jgi:hypothetical protein